jgi:lipoyl-dependent peroxiredoxin
MRLGSGAFDGQYDSRSRMGDGKRTNPEELLGAAHAGCFSMALTLQLASPSNESIQQRKSISKSATADGPFTGSISTR